MKITSEINLSDFKFWSGAEDNAELLTNTQLDEIGNILEDEYPGGINETELNDIFRFDFEYVCSLIDFTPNEDETEEECDDYGTR